ncbi:MAG: hypothetical protein AAFZ01_13845 [Pseudomonadota bacterium]
MPQSYSPDLRSALLRIPALCALSLWLAPGPAAANDLIPTLEDAGYAFEATRACNEIQLKRATTRRLRRSTQFRAGRRMFLSAAKQWGEEWTCETARNNLGPTIDLSDFDSGRLVIQPPPSEIPPLPTRKSSLTRTDASIDADN